MAPLTAVSSFQIFPSVLMHGIIQTMSLSQKVYHLTRNSFLFFQGWCLGGYGVKEISVDGFWERHKARKTDKEHLPYKDPIHEQLHNKMQMVRKNNGKYAIGHGALFMGAGVSGALSGLNKLELIHLGKATPWIDGISSGFFILANIVALEHHIRLYRHACQIPKDVSPVAQETARKLKISSISGMISNISYILTGATLLFGAPMALALVFGCIGITTGCFKIIYDFFFLDIGKQLEKAKKEAVNK